MKKCGINLCRLPVFCALSFLAILNIFGAEAFADSSFAFSSDPGSGRDPWALLQLMISVGTEIWYVIKIVLVISGIVGLIFIILGCLKIRAHALDSQSSGGHLKHGIILVLLGGLLFGAPVLTMLTGNSLFGSAPAPVATESQVYCQVVNGDYNNDGSCIPLTPPTPSPTPSPNPPPVPTPTPAHLDPAAVCPVGQTSFNGSCWFGPVQSSIVQYVSGAFYPACFSNNGNLGSYSVPNTDETGGSGVFYLKTESEESGLQQFIQNVSIWCE
jgi:hypothetical protein